MYRCTVVPSPIQAWYGSTCTQHFSFGRRMVGMQTYSLLIWALLKLYRMCKRRGSQDFVTCLHVPLRTAPSPDRLRGDESTNDTLHSVYIADVLVSAQVSVELSYDAESRSILREADLRLDVICQLCSCFDEVVQRPLRFLGPHRCNRLCSYRLFV